MRKSPISQVIDYKDIRIRFNLLDRKIIPWIGHGSQVGEHSVLAAQVGVAGSTRIGKGVWVGGQVGFAGHMEVGDKAVITAQSGSSHDIPPGAVMSGSPAFENANWLRSDAAFAKLPNLVRKLRDLEREVADLKKRLSAADGK